MKTTIPHNNIHEGTKMGRLTLIGLVIILGLFKCRDYQYMPDMNYSPGIDAQQIEKQASRKGNINLPKNSVAHYTSNINPYPLTLADLSKAQTTIVNPYNGNAKEILKMITRGKDRYRIFCAPCHGMDGGKSSKNGFGTGPVIRAWGSIPSLFGAGRHLRKAREDYTLSEFYHVMTAGVGSMNSYASQINEYDRWAIAYYIKDLQKGNK